MSSYESMLNESAKIIFNAENQISCLLKDKKKAEEEGDIQRENVELIEIYLKKLQKKIKSMCKRWIELFFAVYREESPPKYMVNIFTKIEGISERGVCIDDARRYGNSGRYLN